MSVLPAPFGFGIWTAHVTPTLLGAPTVVMPRFDADVCLELIERERVTVLAAVSTQFVMLLNAATLARPRPLEPAGDVHRRRDGAVPARRRVRGAHRLRGAAVLRLERDRRAVRTDLDDPRERRLRTAGRVIPEMHVRLFDEDGADVTATGGPGIAACKGAVTCLGYYDDPEANAKLYTADGWMLTGDLCTIDADGYLTVGGRRSDFIIRGGKNISAAVVEDEVSTHPSVAWPPRSRCPTRCSASACACTSSSTPGTTPLELDALREHLAARGVGKELWPERIVVVDAIPRASGGKVAKGELRDDIRRRLAEEA